MTSSVVRRPELVVGLVAPLGAELDPVVGIIKDQLLQVGYSTCPIKLSELLEELQGLHAVLRKSPEFDRYRTHMDAGDELRQRLAHDAMARLAISRIRELRRRVERDIDNQPIEQHLVVQFADRVATDEIRQLAGFVEFITEQDRDARFSVEPDLGTAVRTVCRYPLRDVRLEPPTLHPSNEPVPEYVWLLRSLKHPSEIDLLRRIYGSRFLLLGVVAPKALRAERLSAKLAQSMGSFDNDRFLAEAYHLIRRDEDDLTKEHGQKTREAFWKADFVLAAGDEQSVNEQVQRMVRLFFGDPYISPSRDEVGMMHAATASRRSSSLSRQVGAALLREDGSVASVGCNDVPKPFGGQYWDGDHPDHRDHVTGRDISDDLRQRLLSDLVRRLQAHGWLAASMDIKIDEDFDSVLKDLEQSVLSSPVGPGSADDSPMDGKSRLLSLIEFMRAVHAEMAALMDAGRHGVSVAGSHLYTTTFPCHECSKHIVSAGIRGVTYVEPYPKSLARELVGHAITIEDDDVDVIPFMPFTGVGPRRFLELFNAPRRKDSAGRVLELDLKENMPRVAGVDLDPRFSMDKEQQAVQILFDAMVVRGISWLEGDEDV